MITLKQLVVGAYGVNCTIVTEAQRVWIVDPGSDGPRIVRALAEAGATPAGILLTHAHFDHIGAVPALQKAFPGLPVYVHPADRPMFGHPLNQCPPDYASVGLPDNVRDPRTLEGVTVIETPGHTPGGVCYHFPEAELLLSGDTLFAGSVGRTDFPGGDMGALRASLARLANLPDATRVIPGHGPETTIGTERRTNPFLIM